MPLKDKRFAKEYLHARTDRELAAACVRAVLASVANTAIVPMQDYLELGSEGRINTPSTLGNNWKWRMDKDALTDELADKIFRLTKLYGRL